MRTSNKGLRRLIALVCSVALCASMMPTAVFAVEPETTPEPEPTPVTTLAPEPTPSESPEVVEPTEEPTTTPSQEPEVSPEPSAEPESTAAPETSPEPSEEPSPEHSESPEPSEEPEDSVPMPMMLSAGPANASAIETRSGPPTTNSQAGNDYITLYYNKAVVAPSETTLTVKVQSEDGKALGDPFTINNVVFSERTMRVSVSEEYYAQYSISSVAVQGGGHMKDLLGSLNDEKNKTFTYNANYGSNDAVLVVTLQEAQNENVITLKDKSNNVFGTISYDSSEYPTGQAKQNTTVYIYLNDEYIATVEDLNIPNTEAATGTKNFVLALHDGYYFKPETPGAATTVLDHSTIDGQTVFWHKDTRDDRYSYLTFGNITAEGDNYIILHFYGNDEKYKSGTPINIKVYLENQNRDITDKYDQYVTLSGMTDDIYPYGYQYKESTNSIECTYLYETYNCADIVMTAKPGYTIQAVKASLVYGQKGSNGITETKQDGSIETKADNVSGGSTMEIYLAPAYTVEYYVDNATTASDDYTDANVYSVDNTGLAVTGTVPENTETFPEDDKKPNASGQQKEYQVVWKANINSQIALKTASNLYAWYPKWDASENTVDGTPIEADQVALSAILDQKDSYTVEGNVIKFYGVSELPEPEIPSLVVSDLGKVVNIHCTVDPAHGDYTENVRGAENTEYTIEYSNDGKSATVTILNKALPTYVKVYNSHRPGEHALDTLTKQDLTFKVRYNAETESWELDPEDTATIYVACVPEAPTAAEIGREVKVVCVNANADHGGKDYSLIGTASTDYDVTAPERGEDGVYTVTVTVHSADPYLAEYEKAYGEHILYGCKEEQSFTMKFENGKWVTSTFADDQDGYKHKTGVVYKVTCLPGEPEYEDINTLLKDHIIVDCINPDSGHYDKAYDLMKNDYTVTMDGLNANVEVPADYYVSKYSSDFKAEHKLAMNEDAVKSFALVYDPLNGTWGFADGEEQKITFEVVCKPEEPNDKEAGNIIGRKITVGCLNEDVDHHAKDYKLLGAFGTDFLIGEVTVNDVGQYVVTVTIPSAQPYVDKFSSDYGDTAHALIGEDVAHSFTLLYDEQAFTWTLAPDTENLRYDVICAPTAAEIGRNVKVLCTTNDAHTGKDYPLQLGKEGVDYTLETVTSVNGVPTVRVNMLSADTYVNAYVKEFGNHVLASDCKAEQTFTMVYQNGVWTLDEKADGQDGFKTPTGVVYKVVCQNETTEPEKPSGGDNGNNNNNNNTSTSTSNQSTTVNVSASAAPASAPAAAAPAVTAVPQTSDDMPLGALTATAAAAAAAFVALLVVRKRRQSRD